MALFPSVQHSSYNLYKKGRSVRKAHEDEGLDEAEAACDGSVNPDRPELIRARRAMGAPCGMTMRASSNPSPRTRLGRWARVAGTKRGTPSVPLGE